MPGKRRISSSRRIAHLCTSSCTPFSVRGLPIWSCRSSEKAACGITPLDPTVKQCSWTEATSGCSSSRAFHSSYRLIFVRAGSPSESFPWFSYDTVSSIPMISFLVGDTKIRSGRSRASAPKCSAYSCKRSLHLTVQLLYTALP